MPVSLQTRRANLPHERRGNLRCGPAQSVVDLFSDLMRCFSAALKYAKKCHGQPETGGAATGLA